MFRTFDFECDECGDIIEWLVKLPQGYSAARGLALPCDMCGDMTLHHRLISMTQKYLADRPMNVMVAGGKFDTMGAKVPPKLPPRLPPSATFEDYRHRWNTPEYKEAKAEILNTHRENRAKKKRAELIKQGKTINMRTDKLPGDPKVVA